MPTRCIPCGGAVHEAVVKCPHCGQRTGASPRAPSAADLVAITKLDEERFLGELETASQPGALQGTEPFGVLVAVDMVAGVVGAAIQAVSAPRREPDPALPRAVARERPRPSTVEPIASEAPDPAPPPSDHPRYLK